MHDSQLTSKQRYEKEVDRLDGLRQINPDTGKAYATETEIERGKRDAWFEMEKGAQGQGPASFIRGRSAEAARAQFDVQQMASGGRGNLQQRQLTATERIAKATEKSADAKPVVVTIEGMK